MLTCSRGVLDLRSRGIPEEALEKLASGGLKHYLTKKPSLNPGLSGLLDKNNGAIKKGPNFYCWKIIRSP